MIEQTVERAAWLRVVSGLHFPSDLVGSRAVSAEALHQFNLRGTFSDARDQARLEFE